MLKTASLASRLSLKSIEQSLRVSQGRQFHASTAALARILCSDPIDQVCVDVLGAHGHDVVQKTFKDPKDLLKEIKEYDGLIVRSGTQVTKDVIEAGTNLKLIGRAGTGTDNIDVAAATRHGVIVMNTPGGNTMSAAELTMSLMMSLMRNIPQADASVKAGKWDRKSFMGRQLSGKTIGIVGLGRIGREVARWCQSFGMTTIGYDPILSESASKLSNITPVTLDELYAQSDIISLHVPLSADTKNLINKDSLAKCKDGVRIINCARGGVIDEEALLEGLNSGKVAGAALDVYRVEPPTDDTYDLIQHPKIIATPHLGASTKDAQVRVAHDIAKQFVNAMEGKEFVGVVNAPNIDFAKRSKLMPYLELAEKLGSMQAQLLGGEKLKKIYIIAEGKSISAPEMSEVLTTSVVKGVLSNLLEEEVNFVNALSLAEDMGLSVEEQRKATVEGANYSNQLTIAFETEKGTTRISGTIYGTDQLRLVQIDNFKTDIQPKGEMLLFRNDDRPGVLREVTSILAKAGINIESFELGRTGAGGEALGVITLDDPVPEDVLDEIRSLPFVHNPRTCHLMSLPANFGLDTFNDQKGTAASAYVSVNPKPAVRPANPEFSSGPCKKRPGYSLAKLNDWTLGRSHRSKLGKSQLKLAIEESKRILGLPKDYLLGIVPASDTGAFEMAMWSMLGAKPVDVCYWESFGKGWFGDISTQLKLENVTKLEADYGELPAFEKTNKDHDIIFTWNGTTSGVKVPNADWIHEDRTGLTFNDATSAAFAMPIDWPKVDVTTYSWQKVLGGEGAHGVLILSPKAVERLETYTPPRPLPKIFRMVKKGKVDRAIFEGSTINTPSMLCVEDYLDALRWADSIGGLDGLIGRSQANFRVLENFVQENNWIDFLAKDPATRSNTSVCLTLKLAPEKVKAMVALLEKEGVALDIGAYRDAPAGLRIWCGATVEKEDLEALMPWLSWAYHEVSAS